VIAENKLGVFSTPSDPPQQSRGIKDYVCARFNDFSMNVAPASDMAKRNPMMNTVIDIAGWIVL
jgi:hypothetical protein